jgi:trehalose 6-phosphate synthase/phosphatase
MQNGLIIVSNRLPVSVREVDGKLEFSPSPGGLPTALASYVEGNHNKWIGWPGIASDDLSAQDRQQITEELLVHNCYPVFLTQKQINDYYNGYSNSVLWPVFHDGKIGEAAHGKKQAQLWTAYQRVNKVFAEAVLRLSDVGDTIWVHDYQLFILPALLRLKRPYDRIGLFSHIPFPKFEQLGQIADREALLAGMLGADLIGLHIDGYVQNFLEAVQHYDIGLTEHHKVILPDRVVRVTDFPIGIDYAKYEKARKSRAVSREYTKLRLKYAGLKVILAVDRLDPAKGLVEKVQAYQTLLREDPKLHDKVVLVMIVIHTRTGVAEYEELKERLETIINKTNREFATKLWKPIEYIPHTVPFEQLTALYRRANVAFVTPLRDGMNLVAKEYLASKPYQRGVLVLSREAGAAHELKDAVMVDPMQPSTLVKGLAKALDMRPEELKRRVRRMQRQLAKSNVHVWAKNFTRSLQKPIPLPARPLNASSSRQLIADYHRAKRRALFLDYDGALAEIVLRPEEAIPTKRVLSALKALAKDSRNTVFVLSGRNRKDLDNWLGSTNIGLVAEHGAFVREPGKTTWRTTGGTGTGWKTVIRPILDKYAVLTPQAHVEEKSTALVWHYREAPPYHAQKNIVLLKKELKEVLPAFGLKVHSGKKVIEIKHKDIKKGDFIKSYLRDNAIDFTLAAGDDYTDETMFKVVPADAYSLKIGAGVTAAHFRLRDVKNLVDLLEKLAA